MTPFMPRRTVLTGALAATTGLALGVARPALAATTHTVQMLNINPEKTARMLFLPRILVVQPGDTVVFETTDRGHNSVTYDDMLPAGAEGWNGRINEEIAVTLDQPGFYGYNCMPHKTMGMVGLVIVQGDGMMDNLAAARGVEHRGRASDAWAEIWAEVDAMELSA